MAVTAPGQRPRAESARGQRPWDTDQCVRYRRTNQQPATVVPQSYRHPPPNKHLLHRTSVQRLIGAMLMEGLLARLVHYFTAPSFDTEHSAGLWRLPCACHSWGLPCACTSTSDLVPSEYWILCGNPMLGPRRAFSKS